MNAIEHIMFEKDSRAFIETGKRGTATAAFLVRVPTTNVWHVIVATVHYYIDRRPWGRDNYDHYVMYKVVDSNIPFARGKTVRSLLDEYAPLDFVELDPKDVLSECFVEFL